MTIDFGSIKGYNSDRGFGFVGHTFFNPDGKVFFHIKTIRRKHPELAKKLESGEAFETVNFWYEIETTEKGEQVSKLWLNADHIPQSYAQELSDLIQKVESIWKNIGSQKPSWLDLVTRELVGVNRRDELSVERDNLESQLRAAEEEQRREAEALLQNEIVKTAKKYDFTTEAYEILKIAKKYDLDTTKAYEILKIAKKYELDITKVYEILKIAKKYGLDTAKVDEILSIAKKYGLDTAKVDEILSIAKKYDLDITKVYEILKITKKYDLDTAKVDEILKIAKKYDLDAAEVDEILRIAKRYRLDITSADELYRLLKDLGSLGFTHSTQLSDYIRINQLGYRYPNISGIVTMNNGGRAWEFTGGFSREVYRIICQELGLANQGTSAIATDFESFQEIYSRNQK
jgi:cold shock CspA family protein